MTHDDLAPLSAGAQAPSLSEVASETGGPLSRASR